MAINHREISTGSQEQQKLQDFITKQKGELKKLAPENEFEPKTFNFILN